MDRHCERSGIRKTLPTHSIARCQAQILFLFYVIMAERLGFIVVRLRLFAWTVPGMLSMAALPKPFDCPGLRPD